MGWFKSAASGGEKVGSGLVGAVNKVGGGVVDAAAASARAVGGAAAGGVGAAAGGALGVAKGIVKSPIASLKGVVGVAAIAAAVGGIYMAVRGNTKKQAKAEAMTAAALNDLPPPMPDMAAMQQGTMMGVVPQPGAFAAREDARRGVGTGQQLGM